MSSKIAEVLEGKESIKSFFFNDMSSDTDTDLDLGSGGHLALGIEGHHDPNSGPSSKGNLQPTTIKESPRKPINLAEFIIRKTT